MINQLFAIYDCKTEEFDAPFMARSDGDAKRMFSRVLTNVPLMKDNPKDFDLYYIGDYSTNDASVKSVTPPKFIVSGLSLLEPKGETSNETDKQKVPHDTPIQQGAQG